MSLLERQSTSSDTLAVESGCGGDCCRTTDDGGVICLTPAGIAAEKSGAVEQERQGVWKRVRGGLALGVACLASPCCTPLIVPVVLSLIAGTPLAVLLSQYIGWVYGGLTLFSVVSFALAWRWMKFNQSVLSSQFNEKELSNV